MRGREVAPATARAVLRKRSRRASTHRTASAATSAAAPTCSAMQHL